MYICLLEACRLGSGEMGKPAGARAQSPMNSVVPAFRREACFEGPPTRPWWGAYYLA